MSSVCLLTEGVITQHLYNCHNCTMLLHNRMILLHSCMSLALRDHLCIFCMNFPTQIHNPDKVTALLHKTYNNSAMKTRHLASCHCPAIFAQSECWLSGPVTIFCHWFPSPVTVFCHCKGGGTSVWCGRMSRCVVLPRIYVYRTANF